MKKDNQNWPNVLFVTDALRELKKYSLFYDQVEFTKFLLWDRLKARGGNKAAVTAILVT